MNKRQAIEIARQSGLRRMVPGDVIMSPYGKQMYIEPRFIVPGWDAFAFTYKDMPIGVLIIRAGQPTKLRYCDWEGAVQDETIAGDSRNEQMRTAMQRMTVLIKQFLGERHPMALAAGAPANTLPA